MKDNFLVKTARLTIRRAHFEDWKFLQSIWISVSNTIYAQYDCPYSIDDESVKKKLELWSSYNKSYDEMFFSVCLENIVIGSVNINKDGETDEYEIGYCFHTDYHRKGYAKESISAILNYLKTKGIYHFKAGTGLENIPSVKLLNSLGFKQIGTEKVSFYKDEQRNDIIFDGGIYELILKP